jgi:hypothetical protein
MPVLLLYVSAAAAGIQAVPAGIFTAVAAACYSFLFIIRQVMPVLLLYVSAATAGIQAVPVGIFRAAVISMLLFIKVKQSCLSSYCHCLLLQLLASKLSLLASSGLLQQQQPQDSQLLLTAAAPLPDELLTIVQVCVCVSHIYHVVVSRTSRCCGEDPEQLATISFVRRGSLLWQLLTIILVHWGSLA